MKTKEELLDKLIELESDYENLEQDYYLYISVLTGIILHLYWGKWLISIAIPIVIFWACWKFLAKKPFTSDMDVIEDDESD